MRDRNFWTKANRKTIITRSELFEIPKGDMRRTKMPLFSRDPEKLKTAIGRGRLIWLLTVHYRTGLGNEEKFHRSFQTSECALSAQKKYKVGAELDLYNEARPVGTEFDVEDLSVETILSEPGFGESTMSIMVEALHGAGVVSGKKSSLSEPVRDWVGQAGTKALIERFGDSWQAVAALEYCEKHFHRSSLATLAARTMVAHLLAPTGYEAGYAARELEMVYSGAEELALKSMETRKLAGAGGASSSRNRRVSNLELLVVQVEKLAGAVGLVSEDRIVEQAIETARECEPNFPKSKKTLDDYGTALRSEEPFKSRYEAVFRKNA